ncbi:MAG TPA: hypothetical protein VJY47_01470 [Candidatus Dojkabacteria bacterium]|nr:hypothetical protein [Candidatus Dojkabacteria bacterium]
MTYILVEKRRDVEKKNLRAFLGKIFKKEISMEDLETNPDIHNLENIEKNSIGIEEVKELQKEMIYKPFQEKKQVAIIHDAQKLTHEAQNSLLKALEESKSYSVYILHVDNERNLLPTIRSRSRIVYTQPGKSEDIDNLTDIFEKDLVTQFAQIEKFSESRDSANEFINAVENGIKERFETNIKNGNIDGSRKNLEALKIVQNSREKIAGNCNRRLTLEAMLVQLNS